MMTYGTSKMKGALSNFLTGAQELPRNQLKQDSRDPLYRIQASLQFHHFA